MRHRIAAACLTLAFASAAPGQEEVPDSIAVDRVPPIPGDVAAMLAKYRDGRAASFQDWASGRREVLFLTRAGATNQVFAAAAPGGEKR